MDPDYLRCCKCDTRMISITAAFTITDFALKHGRRPAPLECENCGSDHDLVRKGDALVFVKPKKSKQDKPRWEN